MDRSRKLAALVRALGSPSSTSSMKVEVAFVCPKPDCRKDRKKLAVNLVSDAFHCWICGFAGRSLVPLLRHGRQEDLEEYVSSKEREPERVEHHDPVVLPPEFEPLWKPGLGLIRARAESYLKARGATLDDVVRMRLGFCEAGKLSGRVVFPSYGSSSSLDFVLGRTFVDDLPKYLNGGRYSKDIVFNETLIDWRSPVTLVEGPFDSLIAGWNSIPLLGKSILPKLRQKLIVSGVDVFVALDLDAKRDGLRLIERLITHGVNCKFVPMGGKKDVGSMTRAEFEDAKRDAINVDSDVSMIRASLETLF
jgi:hypothetical protein